MWDVHRNTALNKLSILVELGKIERKGNGKRVYYVRCAQCAQRGKAVSK